MAIERPDLVGKSYTPRGAAAKNYTATSDVLRAVDVTEECRAHPGFRLHHPARQVLLLYTRTWKGIYVSIITCDGGDAAGEEGCSGGSLQEFKDQLRWFDAQAEATMAKLRPLQMGSHDAVELLEKFAPP